jgi:hypothetical protein
MIMSGITSEEVSTVEAMPPLPAVGWCRPFDFDLFASFVKSLRLELLGEYESYSLSPGYYELTGRNGGWMFSDGHAAVVVCRHPNRPQTILVYPEISDSPDYRLTLDIVSALLEANLHVNLVRYGEPQRLNLLKCMEGEPHLRFNVVLEDVLDWRYPVHVLGTAEVVERVGGGFQQIRQRLRKLDPATFSVVPLSPDIARLEVLNHVYRWATNFGVGDFCMQDLVAPATKMLEMFCARPEHFSGQVIMIRGEIESCCIWENPIRAGQPANQLVVCSSNSIKGLSEWQVVKMCEKLHQDGITSVNLGGSETHGLDRFKRKFAPVMRWRLETIEVGKV